MKLLIILTISTLTYAKLWHADRKWTIQDEQNYSAWLKTEAVNKDMFVSPSSRWYGISADCADASYAFRIIYSYENNLPFAILNPSGFRKAYKNLSNDLNKFDHIQDRDKRLIAFINYIGNSVGTENLSNNDTYPVALSSIDAGTLYTYKIRTFKGYVRHSYNIKDVAPAGNFRLIYATQAIKKEKKPMRDTWNKNLGNLPHGNWGFKRFIWPSLEGKKGHKYPIELAYSQEQYPLSKKLGKKFFKTVKDLLATEEETEEQEIIRVFNGLCSEAKARVEYVNQGAAYNSKIGGRCMDYTEYDIYSTPARDKALKNTFFALKELLDNSTQSAGIETVEIIRSLYDANRSLSDDQDLMNLCRISFSDDLAAINLGELFSRQERGLLSSHPNDRVSTRWGEDKKYTKCKRWY